MNFASLEGRRDGREQREPGKGRRGRAGQTAGRGWNGFLCRLREMDFLNIPTRLYLSDATARPRFPLPSHPRRLSKLAKFISVIEERRGILYNE